MGVHDAKGFNESRSRKWFDETAKKLEGGQQCCACLRSTAKHVYTFTSPPHQRRQKLRTFGALSS